MRGHLNCVSNMQSAPRSPIKDKPLRHAGQSLEEERNAVWEDKVEPYLLLALVFVVLAALEWWRWYRDMRPNPALFSVAALAFTAFGLWKFWRNKPKLQALRQGAEGEKVVGQFLERMREREYQVFHDIVGPGFNVDHVLIGRAGIFTIETKTWSKPASGDARIAFHEGRLLAAGNEPDREPIAQARAQSRWMANLLKESTGKEFQVLPVVVFPGWFVEPSKDRPEDVWVLEPKALPAFIENEPSRLMATDVKLASFHLSRFIRSVERAR